MKLSRSVLVFLVLVCCSILLLISPPSRVHADPGDTVCQGCTTTKNNCVFACGSNNECIQNCNNNYSFCVADHCKPLIE